MNANYRSLGDQQGMTLLEVMVGFVIFTASLVAILDYVSNQVYLNHLTEKNQLKANIIYDFSTLTELGENAQVAYVSSLPTGLGVTFNSIPVDGDKKRRDDAVLLQTSISIVDQSNTYEWSIFEIK